MADNSERAVVRLRPNVSGQGIRHGFPWVYANELVTDRRTKAITPGAIVTLEDASREPVATVSVNPASRLIARVMDRDPKATIDAAWIKARLSHALALRERVFETPFYRWVHAEGDGLSGMIIDRFGDIAVIQPNATWVELMLNEIAGALGELAPDLSGILVNASGRARAQEGLDGESRWLKGGVDGPVPVPMNGATYMADLVGGQKTGLFFDQRDNHRAFAGLAASGSVLDVFSHVGGFGLAALAAGARNVLAVDGSAPALELATAGAGAMGVGDRFDTQHGDAFAAMENLISEGRTFDAVVCDPPAFAPSKKALGQGLRAYERVARLGAQLVAPGGYLGLCSCSHAAELSKFMASSTRGIGRAGRSAQLIRTGFASADHPQVPQLGESGYLKTLFFRMME